MRVRIGADGCFEQVLPLFWSVTYLIRLSARIPFKLVAATHLQLNGVDFFMAILNDGSPSMPHSGSSFDMNGH